jgi:hypothetical protein
MNFFYDKSFSAGTSKEVKVDSQKSYVVVVKHEEEGGNPS